MHVISRKNLLGADRKHGGLGVALDALVSNSEKSAKWKSLGQVEADLFPRGRHSRGRSRMYTVFHVSGNSYRLVTEIFYEDQTVLVRHDPDACRI